MIVIFIRLALHSMILASFAALMVAGAFAAFEPPKKLEIHYINVGQGGATLIIGPDGTRILYDFGDLGRGKDIVNYLVEKVGLRPKDGIHFAIVSHRDRDHYGGYVDLIDAGFDILVANFDSGSNKPATAQMKRVWLTPAAKRTTAGSISRIPVGLRIPLGDGAEARVVAANGKIYKSKEEIPFARNENDRSVVLYIKYGAFDYILDGDLGSGPEECTKHETFQRRFQPLVADALIKLEWMQKEKGVDVLHIAHHGSESSTSAEYYNLMKPEVGLISVGLNQGSFLHPREDVVESVLIGPSRKPPPCLIAPALRQLFQTEPGLKGTSSTGSTSFKGTVIGDIKLVTDGKSNYRISGTGRVHGRSTKFTENPPSGFWTFPLDEPKPETGNACLLGSS